jgi:F-type H+-transporting ATPase subunit delta
MMANLTSIARPYALAAFDYARDKQRLQEWKAFLAAAKIAVKDPQTQTLLNHPEIDSNALFDFMSSVLAKVLDAERTNFLRLVAKNDRLIALPEIADLFNAYFAALEKVSTVKVVTAVDIDSAFRKKLSDALTRRIQHEVKLDCEVNPAILGGAVIHIGDKVIDGSVRGKLNRLLEFSLR